MWLTNLPRHVNKEASDDVNKSVRILSSGNSDLG